MMLSFFVDLWDFGFDFTCENSQYKFESSFFILGYYDDDSCSDFNYFYALRADYCIGISSFSYKYTSSNKKYHVWYENGDCEGEPTFSVKYPTGICGGASRKLAEVAADDAPPDPGAGSSSSNFGSSITTTGSINSNSGGGDNDDDVGIIVGAVIGAVVGLCLLVGLAFFCMKRNSKVSA